MFLKILVVEDFDLFRRFICSKLESRTEFHITQASDGFEAVQKAEELQPDLVLLDIGLPNLDGIEVARRVGKIAPLAKILFLSTWIRREFHSFPSKVAENVAFVSKMFASVARFPQM